MYGMVFTGETNVPSMDTFHKNSHQQGERRSIISKCFTDTFIPNYLETVLLFYLTHQFLLLNPSVLFIIFLPLQSHRLEMFPSVFTIATSPQPKLVVMSLRDPSKV